jgi:uncharacterized protein (DUF305 family)
MRVPPIIGIAKKMIAVMSSRTRLTYAVRRPAQNSALRKPGERAAPARADWAGERGAAVGAAAGSECCLDHPERRIRPIRRICSIHGQVIMSYAFRRLNTSSIALLASIAAVGAACATSSPPAHPKTEIVQPGAPGQAPRVISAAAATDLSKVRFVEADVKFIQGMIGHHAQAVEMVELLKQRTTNPDMQRLGLRIAVSQEDEIKMMQTWLQVRGQPLPDPHAHHMHPEAMMPGMLTQAEMDTLAAARGPGFDRLFLEGMIKHHGGAITMVDDLFKNPGAAQDAEIYAFATDVDNDQRMEINRMGAMLDALLKEQKQ